MTKADLAEKLLEVIEQVVLLDRKVAYDFEDVRLYSSEIHLAQFINKTRNVNGTLIAAELGITKGAISQTISRLEKKGLITKDKDPNSKNEMTIHFTALGKRAIAHFSHMRQQIETEWQSIFEGFSNEECDMIHRFLVRLEDRIHQGISV